MEKLLQVSDTTIRDTQKEKMLINNSSKLKQKKKLKTGKKML